ncbi:MAG: PIG-L deacetylase family protein, partial [Rudaea sp.]
MDKQSAASQRVMVVEAHPDDVEWYAGGTIASLATQGSQVTLVICTEGERGSYNPEENPVTLAMTRKQEQRAAADLIGIGEIVYLGHPDGGLEPAMELRRELAVLYRKHRPDLLITFDPWKRYELHPDHIAAGKAALDARMAAKMPLFYTHTRSLG